MAQSIVVVAVAVAVGISLFGFFRYVAPDYEGLFVVDIPQGVYESTLPITDASAGETKDEGLVIFHQFTSGVHEIRGSILLPTPCYRLAVRHEFQSREAMDVRLVFETTPGSELCSEVITPQNFYISFSGDAEVNLSAVLNGSSIKLTRNEE